MNNTFINHSVPGKGCSISDFLCFFAYLTDLNDICKAE